MPGMDWKVVLLYVLSCLLVLTLLLCGTLLYLSWHHELFRRPSSKKGTDVQTVEPEQERSVGEKLPAEAEMLPGKQNLPVGISAESIPLWTKLQQLMREEEVWRDPGLSLNQLSAMLGSNRTRVGRLMQEMGYEGYKDFVNRYRVEAFLKLADAGEVTSIQDAFFSVGYQSKMTALRHFKEYVGMTPTEYLKREKVNGEMEGSHGAS